MDENNKVEQSPIIESVQETTPGPVAKTSGGNRNLILVIGALVVGAAIVIGVFNALFPNSTGSNETSTPAATQVTDVKNTSGLDKVDSELDSTNLNNFQTELNQNDTDAASF